MERIFLTGAALVSSALLSFAASPVWGPTNTAPEAVCAEPSAPPASSAWRSFGGAKPERDPGEKPRSAYWSFSAGHGKTWVSEPFEGQTLKSLFPEGSLPATNDVIQILLGSNVLLRATAKYTSTSPSPSPSPSPSSFVLTTATGAVVDDFVIPRYHTLEYVRVPETDIELVLSGTLFMDEAYTVNSVIQGNIDFNKTIKQKIPGFRIAVPTEQ